jgi:hypothetical protein
MYSAKCNKNLWFLSLSQIVCANVYASLTLSSLKSTYSSAILSWKTFLFLTIQLKSSSITSSKRIKAKTNDIFLAFLASACSYILCNVHEDHMRLTGVIRLNGLFLNLGATYCFENGTVESFHSY